MDFSNIYVQFMIIIYELRALYLEDQISIG